MRMFLPVTYLLEEDIEGMNIVPDTGASGWRSYQTQPQEVLAITGASKYGSLPKICHQGASLQAESRDLSGRSLPSVTCNEGYSPLFEGNSKGERIQASRDPAIIYPSDIRISDERECGY